MPQTLMTIQAGKLEHDVPGKGGLMKVWQHLSGANFPVQVHGDNTTYSRRTEVGSRSRQDQ